MRRSPHIVPHQMLIEQAWAPTIEVADTGIGMSESDLPRIFNATRWVLRAFQANLLT